MNPFTALVPVQPAEIIADLATAAAPAGDVDAVFAAVLAQLKGDSPVLPTESTTAIETTDVPELEAIPEIAALIPIVLPVTRPPPKLEIARPTTSLNEDQSARQRVAVGTPQITDNDALSLIRVGNPSEPSLRAVGSPLPFPEAIDSARTNLTIPDSDSPPPPTTPIGEAARVGERQRPHTPGPILPPEASAYLFGAICPERGEGAALVMPRANTEAMDLHLEEISRAVAPNAHAVVLLDQAAWHTTAKLGIPENISLVPLPPKSPELNPAENVWQYLRQNWLSNRVFDSYEAIVEASCQAWNNLTDLGRSCPSASERGLAQVNVKGGWYYHA